MAKQKFPAVLFGDTLPFFNYTAYVCFEVLPFIHELVYHMLSIAKTFLGHDGGTRIGLSNISLKMD